MSSLFIFLAATTLLTLLLAGVAQPVSLEAQRFAGLHGHRVHYTDSGQGKPTLVFVHGWGGNGSFWRANAPVFAGRHRVVRIDLPGHGTSDAPAVEYTMGYFADAVAKVLQHAEVERAVIVAHSMGTAVGCRVLRDRPECVAALVSVDGAMVGYDVTPAQRDEFLGRFRGPDYRAEVTKFVGCLFRQRVDPVLRERVCAEILQTPQGVLVSAFAGLLDASSWVPACIAVPLLMVNAPSPLWNAAYLARVRALAPRMEYRLIRGAGHFAMLEQPPAFNAALADFLARLFQSQS